MLTTATLTALQFTLTDTLLLLLWWFDATGENMCLCVVHGNVWVLLPFMRRITEGMMLKSCQLSKNFQ